MTENLVIQEESVESNTSFNGYNLFVFERKSGSDYKVINRTLVISDLEGKIYYTKELDTDGYLADFAAELINSTTILYGDSNGANLWNIYTNETIALGFYGHHDYEKNYANNTYFTLHSYSVAINGTEYQYDKIVEYNLEEEIIWQKDTRDFVLTEHWCPYSDLTSNGLVDLTHSNTIFYDEAEDSLYLNMRNTNTFYKIDHKTGKVIWALGEYGDFTMFDLKGKEKECLFYHGHAVEKIDDNTFIIFDNDQHNQTNANNFRSRLLEIEINETTLTANISWEWIAPNDYFSAWWGDSDILPNNNRLGVFGVPNHPETDLGGRIVEVSKKGEVCWELAFPKVGSEIFGVYKIERVRFSPFISVPNIKNISETEKIIEWNVWYNFRSKTNFIGSYLILVDGEVVVEEEIVFPRYWKPTTVNYQLTNLTSGEHFIEIVVSDEGGHLSNETKIGSTIGQISLSVLKHKGLLIGLTVGLSIPLLTGIIVLLVKIIMERKLISQNK